MACAGRSDRYPAPRPARAERRSEYGRREQDCCCLAGAARIRGPECLDWPSVVSLLSSFGIRALEVNRPVRERFRTGLAQVPAGSPQAPLGTDRKRVNAGAEPAES